MCRSNTPDNITVSTCADLTRLMAESRDYDELLMAWKSWRDVTGPHMKAGYEQFVALSNEAVKTLGMLRGEGGGGRGHGCYVLTVQAIKNTMRGCLECG